MKQANVPASMHVVDNAPDATSAIKPRPIGHRNIVWGWSVIALGAISGTILSAWSFAGPFPAPSGFHEYGDLARRMTRLAHIALFMLPIINILIGRDLDEIEVSDFWKQVCSWGAIVSIVSIPGGLILASTIHLWFKFASGPGVTGLTVALLIMGYGTLRRERRFKSLQSTR
jgi:hypothetical protein